jgi:glutathione peroxidase
MRTVLLVATLGLSAVWLSGASIAAESAPKCPPTLDFEKRVLAGQQRVNLCEEHLGKVVLIVNTASKCGYTPQFEGLERLHRDYQDRGLVVLGFPSNDFGGQDPGSEQQTKEFCRLTYDVGFPMYERTHAKRGKAGPLYQTLAAESGEYPRWNFHKYLLDREGRLIASYPSHVDPSDRRLVEAIERHL